DDDAFGAEHVAQLLDERDRSAGSPEDDGLAPLGFEASCRRAQKGAVLGQDHDGAAARAVEFDRASLGQPRTHMRTETLADFLRVLVGDKAEGEAGRGAAGKDGTLAWALIAAGDAVDIDSRTPPHRFERRISFLDDPAREIDLVEKPGLLRQAAPLLAQALRDLAHVVIEAVDRHPPFLVVEPGEDAAEDADRIGCDRAVVTGVEIGIGREDRHALVDEALELRRDRRLRRRPHLAVSYEGDAAYEIPLIRLDEIGKARRAALLFSLEHDDDLRRESAVDGLPRAQRLDEGPELALAVGRATSIEAANALLLDHARFERRMPPLIGIADGLDVVVSVEEQPRAITSRSVEGVAENDGVPLGRNDLRLHAERGKLTLQPVRGAFDVGFRCRLTGNRRDRDQLEKLFKRGLDIVIHVAKHGLQFCHYKSSLVLLRHQV